MVWRLTNRSARSPRVSPLVRSLYETSWVRIGAFECQPGDPAWAAENQVGDACYVVFPGTPVIITQAGARPVVTNANHTIFYNEGQVYRRGLFSADGDRCVFVAIDRELLDDAVVTWGIRPPVGSSFRFPFVEGPLARPLFIGQRQLVRSLDGGIGPDPLAVEEVLLSLVSGTIRDAFAVRSDRGSPARGRRSRVAARRRTEMVEQTRAILTHRYRESIGIDALARATQVSPFHLARTFRASTGYSLHRYRDELRLRSSLDMLSASRDDLTSIALDLGYASHSHFSEAFRRAFGVTPSSYRSVARRIGSRAKPAVREPRYRATALPG